MLTKNGKNNNDGSFDWKDTIIDAGIMAGLTFFTSLGGMSIAGGQITQTIFGAGIAAAAEFFLMLAIKRGLRPKEG